MVNERILSAAPVSWSLMPIEQARAQGAMALFGEKYPDIVRVVQMGDFSRELCGGTHLDSVGQVGLFKVVGEESVAAGIRRITALTGKAALDYVRQEEDILAELAGDPPRAAGAGRSSGSRRCWRRSRTSRSRRASGPATPAPASRPTTCWPSAEEIAGAAVIVRAVGGMSADDMRQLVDVLRRKRPERLAVLLPRRPSTARSSSSPASRRTWSDSGQHAGNWLKEVAPVVGGGGGGRPDLAQAGGKVPDQVPAAMDRRPSRSSGRDSRAETLLTPACFLVRSYFRPGADGSNLRAGEPSSPGEGEPSGHPATLLPLNDEQRNLLTSIVRQTAP